MSIELAVNLGNSNTRLAAFIDSQLLFRESYETKKEGSKEYYSSSFKSFIQSLDLKNKEFKSITIASVVPELDDLITSVCAESLKITPNFICSDFCNPIKFNIPNPKSLGADRIANVAGAYNLRPAIVIDIGTATTLNLINQEAEFEGGIILPGPKTGLTSLISKSSKLHNIDFIWPQQIIGKSTESALQIGFSFGYLSMLEGLLDKIFIENSKFKNVIVTGGMGEFYYRHNSKLENYDPDLTLKGINFIARNISRNN